MFLFFSVNKLVPKFATRYIKENQTCCIAAVESVNLLKSSCEHISKKSPLSFSLFTHSRQHIRLWCIPLWRQTCCLWAMRHSTGCLWEGQGQRQQREPEQRSFIRGDKDKTPFSQREKSEFFKECKQVNFVGNSGKLLKDSHFPIIYQSFLWPVCVWWTALLCDAWSPCEGKGSLITHADMWYSHSTKPSLHVGQQWVLTRM